MTKWSNFTIVGIDSMLLGTWSDYNWDIIKSWEVRWGWLNPSNMILYKRWFDWEYKMIRNYKGNS